MNVFNWVNFILIVAIIITLIVIIIIYVNNRNNTLDSGLPLTIINGTSTNDTDTFIMTGNNIYINQTGANTGLTLTVNSTSDQTPGQVSYIKNNTSNNMLVIGGTANLDTGNLDNTVVNGQTAAYMAVNNDNKWIRLQ